MGKWKHGHAPRQGGRSPEYRSWYAMRRRCTDPRNPSYSYYGGRGIRYCDRWEAFENFLADMGPREEDQQLDRIDNDGDYSPENCRWIATSEQNSNRRNCIFMQHGGERVTLREYCRRTGAPYRRIIGRLHLGWPLDRAMSQPVRGSVSKEPVA